MQQKCPEGAERNGTPSLCMQQLQVNQKEFLLEMEDSHAANFECQLEVLSGDGVHQIRELHDEDENHGHFWS